MRQQAGPHATRHPPQGLRQRKLSLASRRGPTGHFDGFGVGATISRDFWDVLATLYANPPLTASGQLTVRRAAD